MAVSLPGFLVKMLLAEPHIRRRIAFELNQNYYADLETAVPLGWELSCPIYYWPSWYSFTEIFMQQEYARAFETIALPKRFLDLGCHAGFFSLYVLWRQARQGYSGDCAALLVDADSRMQAAVERLIDLNNLQQQLSFLHAAVCSKSGTQKFFQRQHLDSSLIKNDGSEDNCPVNTLSAEGILEQFAPPYDLIKLDIEGAEYDFLASYQSVYQHSKYLLLEWHSWHSGGGGRGQLEQMLTNSGFQHLSEVLPAHEVSIQGQKQTCGVALYQQVNLKT